MTGPTSRSRRRTAHRLRPGRPERDVLVVPVLAHHQLPVAADLRDVVLLHPRHRARVEAGERLPVHVSALEYLRPALVGQHPRQRQKLEQPPAYRPPVIHSPA